VAGNDITWYTISVRRVKLKKQKKKIDRRLLVLTIILSLIGFIAIADASAPTAISNFGDKYHFVKQQIVWGLGGFIALIIVSQIHYSFWGKIAKPLLLISMISLILVLIPGIGTQALGAKRWIFIGNVSIQPSELVKLSLAIYFAKLAEKNKQIVAFLVPLGIVALLMMIQPDLGTTLVIVSLGMIQMFVSGVDLIKFAGASIIGVIASALLVITSGYRRERFLTFLESTRDPLGKSYHIRQVLLALGSGGLFGVGIGQSRQKYLFLPEAATDSIFAVIAEEVGFLGSVVLITLFVMFIQRGLAISKTAPDTFSKILSLGIVSWVGVQAIMNMASMVALVPLTGIPLPFISYGGSALTTILIATGILLNVSKYETQKRVKGR